MIIHQAQKLFIFMLGITCFATSSMPANTPDNRYAQSGSYRQQPDNKTTYEANKSEKSTAVDNLNSREKYKVSLVIIIAIMLMDKENRMLPLKIVAREAITVLAHEFGHAIAAKLLWNNPIVIGLGASKAKEKKTAADRKLLTIENIYPAGGYFLSTKPTKIDSTTGAVVLDKTKQAIMHLAGGICGALAHMACNVIELTHQDKDLSFHGACMDYGVAEQLLQDAILPNNEEDEFKNDARVIWEDCLGITPPKILGKIRPYAVATLLAMNLKNNGFGEKEKQYCLRILLQMLCTGD